MKELYASPLKAYEKNRMKRAFPGTVCLTYSENHNHFPECKRVGAAV